MNTSDSPFEYVLHVTSTTLEDCKYAAPVWHLHETAPTWAHARRMAQFLTQLDEIEQVAITKARKNADGTLTPVADPVRMRKNPLRRAWSRIARHLHQTKPRGGTRAACF